MAGGFLSQGDGGSKLDKTLIKDIRRVGEELAHPLPDGPVLREIGRASCREKSVKSWV